MVFLIFNEIMLIKIPEDIIALAEGGNQDVIGAINEVAKSSYRGYNIIHSTRSGYERLLKLKDLTPQSRSVISRRRVNYTTEASILTHFTTSIEICETDVITAQTEEGKTVIKIPAKLFVEEDSITSRTVLICENLIDADFYKYMFNYYLATINVCNLNSEFRPECGGGNTTCKTYEKYALNNQTSCLCIVDSDKKYSDAKLDETAKRVKEIHTRINPVLCMIKCIELVREIENLIPCNILKEICTSPEHICGYNNICNIMALDAELFLYWDYKKGLKKDKFKKTVDAYLLPKLKQLAINLGVSEVELEQIKAEEEPSGVLFPGLGENVLEKAIQYIEQNSFKVSKSNLQPDQEKEWLAVGEALFNYTGTFSRIRS